jgi:zinc/manganese transport system ATP-binding protein
MSVTSQAGTPREPAIEFDGASFGYRGRTALAGIDASIEAGSAVAIIGPNGSGKSTLLRGILGLADITEGSLRVLGGSPSAALDRIGSLPQADRRDTELPITVRQAVTMGLYRALGPVRPVGRVGRQRVDAALERVGLLHLARRRFGELSGGQQQRAILARALVSDPQILLLDEPFNGLDRANRDMLLATIRELRAEGRTILVSTHDLEIARETCSHVLLLDGHHGEQTAQAPTGCLVAFGPIDEALTLAAVERAFAGATVELDEHTVTTQREIAPPPEPESPWGVA